MFGVDPKTARREHPANTPQIRLDMDKYWRINVTLEGGDMMMNK
ncbi:MAG: hypothetical protein ACJAW4_000654 [Paracoccaceae bacterium]